MRTPRWPLTAAIGLSLTLTACGGTSVQAEPGAEPSASASSTSLPSSSGLPTEGPLAEGLQLIVEIHVPSTPTPGLGKDEYQYPWIFDIEDYLVQLDGSQGEAYDDGESWGEEYLFFLSSGSESQLIAIATDVAKLPGVPKGVYVTVTDSEADLGGGRRVDLKI